MGKLFVSVALAFALGCGICSAQGVVTLDDDKSGDSSQTTDPIVIDGERLTQNWDLKGESVIINASKSTIALRGSCRELTVNGSDNNIRSCKLESLTVNGNNSLVTYPSSCKPKVVNHGKGNDIIARPAPHQS
jgi:hypothetical protein